jgi:hypothetical protein
MSFFNGPTRKSALSTVTKAQAENSVDTTTYSWSPIRVWDSIKEWWTGITSSDIATSATGDVAATNLQSAIVELAAEKQAKLATLVDEGSSFNTNSLDDVTDNAKEYRATAAITVTLETYTDKPDGFQFIVMAVGGNVTFAGTFVGQGGKTVCAQGSCAWVIRDSAGWKVYGVTV